MEGSSWIYNNFKGEIFRHALKKKNTVSELCEKSYSSENYK